MKTYNTLTTIILLLILNAPSSASAFYRLSDTLTIPSPTNPSWDYLTFDSSNNRLFIARREDGILIYNPTTKKIEGTLEDSSEGNATVLVPELNRGYTINEDGTTTIFDLSTCKILERKKFGEDADNGFYDPKTKQILITQGDSSQITFLNTNNNTVSATLKIDSKSIEGAVADGEGNFFIALRDKNKVIKVNAINHTLINSWQVKDHTLPNSVAYDSKNKRLFVTTRGNNPALLVYNSDTGEIVASETIGRGNDQIIFDPETRKIYTANGFDATLVIINQIDANNYKLAEAATTRPYARTMALDTKSKTLYLTTAEGTVDVSKKWKKEVTPFYPNTYFKNTFTLLIYNQQ
jgi:DNA-binding beta-propeller fold protein YncE